MKEVEKKEAPEISGGAALPYVTDPPVVDYPQDPPTAPGHEGGERDKPIWQN